MASLRGMSAPPGASQVTVGAPHPGDESQRVTVQKPRTLQELQAQAQKYFGFKGKKLDLWHQGRYAVQHQHHVDPMKPEDVVVVTWTGELAGARNLTTHQADFVRHPLSRPRARGLPQTPGPYVPFDGQTSYNNDYIKHPLSRSAPVEARKSQWQPSDAPTGATTYATHYTRHPLESKSRDAPMYVPRPMSLPFEGRSSYAQDYVKHAMKPPVARRPEERAAPPGTFDGISTYAAAYVGHLPRPRTPRQRSAPEATRALPFNGNSEYKQEYVKKELALPDKLHLEPEFQEVF